ncbi:MAG: sugar phosphate isomerase/epimerase family protein [Candidatus Latescibacterota bacterium]|nr:sugar phosphate isomerase/epimerase family protein [Candidatus Latescibacterota bacterium]
MKLGLVTYNLASEWDFETLERNCIETGFAGVELRTQHAHGVEIDLDQNARKVLKKRFSESPLEVVGLGSIFEYDSPDQEILQEQIEGTKEYIRLAHDLGVSGIKVRPNKLHESEGVDRIDTLEQIGLSLNQCAEYAQEYGVQLRLEVHGRETCEPKLMRTIMDAAPSVNATICWNSNDSDMIDGDIDASFGLLGDRIGMVHITELWSSYPWARLFQLLRQNGYSGYCLAEISPSQDAIRLMRYYRALFEAFGGMG